MGQGGRKVGKGGREVVPPASRRSFAGYRGHFSQWPNEGERGYQDPSGVSPSERGGGINLVYYSHVALSSGLVLGDSFPPIG